MAGSPRKLPTTRQGHGAATRDVELRKAQPPIPLPPSGLLKKSQQIWVNYWESDVARASDRADAHVLERWIRAVDEYERVLPTFRKARVATGSTGQLVLHPLAAYLAQLKTELKGYETELGLTPMARTRLGIAVGQAQLTADELNRRLNAPPENGAPSVIEAEGWESEWVER